MPERKRKTAFDSERRLGIFLGTAVLTVIAANTLFPLNGYPIETGTGIVGDIARQLDLAREGNFATWLSSTLLFLNALWALRLASRPSHVGSGAGDARIFGLLSFGFLVLSIDDAVQIHEYGEHRIHDFLNSGYDAATSLPSDTLLFGALITILFMGLVHRLHSRSTEPVNRRLLIVSAVLVSIVFLTESCYRALAGYGSASFFRLEVLLEEGSEVSASLTFFFFQAKELAIRNGKTTPACDRGLPPEDR